jgi:acyl carrier protein
VEEFELDPANIQPQLSLYDDLGLDSLDTVDMVIVLEGAFNFKIREEEEIKKITNELLTSLILLQNDISIILSKQNDTQKV